MASSSIVPTFCYLKNIDIPTPAAILEIWGCFIYQDRTFIQFNKVQLHKVPEHDACAVSICPRGFYRSAANAFQEFQSLASSDKCWTAGQKKGKVIFRNEKHYFALIFPNVVIKSHDWHVKIRQTNYSFRKPNQFSLTNFHSQIVLRVITEHMQVSSNGGTFVERAIEDNGGAS